MMASRAIVSKRKETKDNFKVAVRIRPLIAREIRSNASSCVRVDDENGCVSITKPEQRRRQSRIGIEDFGELIRSDKGQVHDFFYDVVFTENDNQEEVFSSCVKDVVESVLQGYNGSIIASGQTGSGKTYTIEGGEGDYKGIIPRAAELIFGYIENYPTKSDRFLVRIAFLEIYNEKISDLMEPNKDNLKIREDGTGGVCVEGLSEHVVRNTEDILQFLRRGAHLRTTASTKMNKESSRSHAVFTIIVEHAEYDSMGESTVTIGKLRMVDLAGSERLDMEAQGRQQEETKNINVSLHTFGKVVSALTTTGVRHIPYRDSKLTRLLQDSLGGNCKTTLIATITQVSTNYTESLNTLKFAKRAKSIKNTASVNKDMSQNALLSSYQQEIKKLKQLLEQRDKGMDGQEIEKLENDVLKAKQEKDEVLSKLEEQQKHILDAQNEKESLLSRIMDLEKMVLRGQTPNDSEEFKKAVEKEHARIRTETEKEFQSKLAELEAERKRLHDEKAEVQKQKEYFAKLRNEFQPDGGKDDDDDVFESKEISVSFRSVSPSHGSGKSSSIKRKASLPARPPPFGAHIPSRSQYSNQQRVASADTLAVEVGPAWAQTSLPHDSGQHLHSPMHSDDVSISALQEYALALAHPTTGIPCQVVLSSGVRIFTGSECVKWFMKNMVGVISMQIAQDVGQRLMDLNIFIEIQGRRKFVISDSVYYQFCEDVPTMTSRSISRHHSNSVPSVRLSYNDSSSSHSKQHGGHRGSISSLASYTSELSTASSMSLNQSIGSLHLESDLLDKFGLGDFQPTELHIVALYGQRQRLRALVRELSPECLDTAGHTPLMYAVFGNQTKTCLHLLRMGINVNAANQEGLTSLLIAAMFEYDDVMKLLLKHGAQTHFTNQHGQNVFHLTAQSRNVKCLEYICKYAKEHHGINVRDNDYMTPLHMAVKANNPTNVKRLLEYKAELGSSDSNGRTALHYAVTEGVADCALAILNAVPNDVNLVDKLNGWSALHLACSENDAHMVSLLTSFQNCNVNLRDKDGRTALHIAVTVNNVNMLKVLLSKKIDVDIVDNSGKTAEQLSYELGLRNCLLELSTNPRE